ncbi:hypothetical protein CPB85DRAFT_806507 [Mucidula mucida]|nr:hypothetical protein CPB85DRAFT_806507 [Mucidula mucida]
MVASWTMEGSSTLVIIGITAANCPIWISYYLLAFNGHKMQTFNVHVAGCWNGDDARGGVGVYWGQNDARNISARCGNAVTDADSAGLDGVIRFLEQLGANSDCSAAPHDGNHFTIRTDNSNIALWLTVNLPSWKEYDWEGDIEHKSLLRYIDALIENARTQAAIEIAVLLVPSHREVAGQSGAMSLAG